MATPETKASTLQRDRSGAIAVRSSRGMASWYRRNRQAVEAWAILAPILTYLFLFITIPLIGVFVVSMTRWTGIKPNFNFAGLDNFLYLFKTPLYAQALRNTVILGGLILLLNMVFGFLIALLLNQKIRGRDLFRTLWYLPVLTSFAVIAQMAVAWLSPTDGMLNIFLKQFGLPQIVWRTDAFWTYIFVIGMSVWRGVGGVVILYLAGLQSIDPSLYEAARVDGADGWQLTRHITIPLIQPMTAFIIITGIIAGFQIFEPAYVFTQGGPNNATNTILLQIYNDAFGNLDMGVASSQSVLLFLALLVVSIFNVRMMVRNE